MKHSINQPPLIYKNGYYIALLFIIYIYIYNLSYIYIYKATIMFIYIELVFKISGETLNESSYNCVNKALVGWEREYTIVAKSKRIQDDQGE